MKKNMILWVVIVVVVLGLLIFITINHKENSMNEADNSINTEEQTPSVSQQAPAANAPTDEARVAKTGDMVAMNYTGRLQDGSVFDSNVDPKFNHVQPFIFTLGAGQVIHGWDTGIVGMKVGEKKTLTIAPEDGYGAAGHPPVIPPNSTLIFDVELLAIK